MVEMEKPKAKSQASQSNNSGPQRPGNAENKAASANVHQMSAVTIALQQELSTQKNVANTRLWLRNAAMAYYHGGSDKTLLPVNEDLANAVIALAEGMKDGYRQVYGEFYCSPDVTDVTTIDVTPMALNPAEFFNTPSSTRQLTGTPNG